MQLERPVGRSEEAQAQPPGTRARRSIALLYGTLCHATFAVGVATMIAAMFFGMSRSLGDLAPPWGVVANAGLLIQFPILHSLLLGRAGAPLLGALAPRSVSRHLSSTTYVIVASLQVFVLFAFWTPSGIVWWQADGPILWAVSSLYAASWLLLLKAIWDAGIALQIGIVGWWAVLRDRSPVFPRMPTDGLFRIVRQPIYVAFALTLWTVPTWTPDQLVVALVLTAYCLIGPLFKEVRFRRRFGAEFTAYSRRVPYWVPGRAAPRMKNDLSIYDASADWWDDRVRWSRTLRNMVPARFAFFDPIVGDWNGKRVLDLGCGGGFMAEALAARGAVVTGIDPVEGAIDAARRHAEAGGTDIDYHVASGENLPFDPHTFDIVVCVDVLEHVDDLNRVIAETRRVLRPDGLFLFDTINDNALASFVMVGLGERLLRLVPPGAHDPSMFVSPADLTTHLHANGFTVGRFAGFGPRGLDRRLILTFGPLPTVAVQYLGYAEEGPGST